MPPVSHVQAASGTARCGQSAAELHTDVQLETRIDESHAAIAMHAFVFDAQSASTFTQTRWFDTGMQP